MDEIEKPQPRSWLGLFGDPKHGPLPSFLIVLTAMTGVVDSVSILSLGRVFVANMTGNVAFVGFALARAPGFSLAASLFALGGFLVGALCGGWSIRYFKIKRVIRLRNALLVELVLFGAALLIAILVGSPLPARDADAIAALLAVALGLQTAIVRHVAVPDLSTTVLTMTLTGIAADTPDREAKIIGRRVLAVTAMIIGAFSGALLVLKVNTLSALVLTVALLGTVLIAITATTRTPADWQN